MEGKRLEGDGLKGGGARSAPAAKPARPRMPAPAATEAVKTSAATVPSPSTFPLQPSPRPEPGRKNTFRLHPADPVVDAPSIGPKTAAKLNAFGIETVADLLAADAHDLADRFDTGWVVPETVRDWRAQAGLMCRVPNLHGPRRADAGGSGGPTTPRTSPPTTPPACWRR